MDRGRDMSKNLIRHLTLLFAYVAGLLIGVYFGDVFITVGNAIFGGEIDGGPGMVAGNIMKHSVMALSAFIIIYRRRCRDADEFDAFQLYLEERPYSAREDLRRLLRDKLMWADVIFVSVISLLYFCVARFALWVLFNIPLFVLFHFFSTLLMHREWLRLIKEVENRKAS